MATKRQIAANRRNAKKCTGPKTHAGKAASSMNAVRHGLRAHTVVLPGEEREDFDEILSGLQDQYQPQNAAERHLVDQAAIAQWKLVRAEVFASRSYDKEPSIKAQCAIFGQMTLITGRLERTYFKAYQELNRIKAARESQSEKAEKSQKSQEFDVGSVPVNLVWVDSKTGERSPAAQSPEPARSRPNPTADGTTYPAAPY